jgi:hypothetical protein
MYPETKLRKHILRQKYELKYCICRTAVSAFVRVEQL